MIVGGGREAEVVIGDLVGSGADVAVVEKEVSENIALLAQFGSLKWVRRSFEPEELDGAFLAIAAAEDADLNFRVKEEARKRGVLCAELAGEHNGDFIIPGSIRRGWLTIAFSTAGISPALTDRIREELSRAYGAEYAYFLDLIRRLQPEIRGSIPDSDTRGRLDAEMVDSPALAFLRGGNLQAAERILRTIVAVAKSVSGRQDESQNTPRM